MPTILNPRDTDRKNRVEDHDSGSGRRPPIDKHTGGGGSGDNDNWDHRRQPRSRLNQFRWGIFSALAGDMLFFGVIVVAMLALRSNTIVHNGELVNNWHTIPLPHILWFNTAILILSSITMEIARRHMFREIDVMEEWLGLGKPTTNHTLPWLAATTVLGLIFLAGQWSAWRQLHRMPLFLQANQSTKFFYITTGVHGAHLFLGIAALIAAIVVLRVSRQLESRQILVDCIAWYWHSMGLFWIFLFTLLVLAR